MKKIFAFCALAFLPTQSANAGEVSDKQHCQTGDIRCVHHVIQEMSKRERKLAKACDHDAIFSLVYLRTTEMYEETAEDLGYADVSSVTREDALFADYYFRAYDTYQSGEGDVPPAWRIAFDAAQAHELTASGNALLGISAHIQRDLPFTLYDLYLQGHPVSYADHTLVNVFLAQVEYEDEIIARFDPTYPPGDGDISGIVYWREIAWQDFEALRDAANETDRAAVAASIEDKAAQAAAYFAYTMAYPPGTDSSERDAFCEENQ